MNSPIRSILAFIMAATASASATPDPDRLLFDFEGGFDCNSVQTTDARISLSESDSGAALHVVTGHARPWPGVALGAPHDHWDLSRFHQIELQIRNTGPTRVAVSCRADNPGADGTNKCVSGSVDLDPGETKRLRIPLQRTRGDTLDGALFGMRGYPVAAGGPGTIDPQHVSQLLVFVGKPDRDHSFEIDEIRATGSWTAPTASTRDAEPYLPLIDTFGQYRHRDWPGKIHSVEEMQARRETEARELVAQPSPPDWNKFGGWESGPRLEASGFFRTQKHEGKWWLVDPEGRLFWSHGIDCVRMTDLTPIDERENWFEAFPGADPGFAEFVVKGAYSLKGHYTDRRPECFSFARANLKRKYGADWNGTVAEVIHRRLRSWGLNTIANWSDEKVRLMRRTAYTDNLGSRGSAPIEGSEGYWGKFPDVFDPTFREALRGSMRAKSGESAGDRWCIGYFSDNEMSWGDGVSLALATLKSPAGQAAKREFLTELRGRYADIAALNAAWGTRHESWEALLADRTAPDRRKAEKDLAAFEVRLAEEYFRTVRDVIREFAPNQLYLGCRFAWANARADAAAAKFCDVVSYNLYRRSVADFQTMGGADVPLIIGEFHFGALDRGLFHTGLVPVENQVARAEAYKEYVRGALAHPQFVGTHWFQYQDEPTTGRVYDEENYQIGFVDVADTPYPETISACRDVAESLYRQRVAK